MNALDLALHESAHAVVAVVLGAQVVRVSIGADGGQTAVVGMAPHVALRAALAGQAASVVFGRGADVRCSEGDYVTAFKHAVRLAADEDGAGLGSECFRAASASVSPDEAAAALARRWVARAHVLVEEAEGEVGELLGRHRLVVRTLAGHLEQWQYLSGRAVHALVEESRLRQADTYENWRAI
jgi:hypothetical protein